MTASRHRRPGSLTTYEQRRRRLRHQGSSLTFSQTPASSLQHRTTEDASSLLWHDVNNNELLVPDDSSTKRYFIGAFIYKTIATEGAPISLWSSEGCLSLHVFEHHLVQVRHTEPESQLLQRISREYSAVAIGKSTFISSLYLVQKYVPVHYSSQSLFELGGKGNNPHVRNQRYQVNLRFQRRYVPVFKHDYPGEEEASETKSYLSSISWNVSG